MEKEFYAFCFLNKSQACFNSSTWRINAIYDHFPTEKEIINYTCLKNTPSDRELAKKLVEGNGDPVRLVYSKDEFTWCEKFFEVMITTFKYGEELKLEDFLVTGYAIDNNEDKIVFFKK